MANPKDTAPDSTQPAPTYEMPKWLRERKSDPSRALEIVTSGLVARLEKDEFVGRATQAVIHSGKALTEYTAMLAAVHPGEDDNYTPEETKIQSALIDATQKRDAELAAAITESLAKNKQTEKLEAITAQFHEELDGKEDVLKFIRSKLVQDASKPEIAEPAPSDRKTDPDFGEPFAPRTGTFRASYTGKHGTGSSRA